ncbi:hypothetical protein [Burkholderia stagnalis]|uniref:hypothetical protein n=1 Tax=Burkholderia stagnalis TaxID=1503054 RepID=UPI001588D7A1|nr:hypothetical protein [Burkholderia stagnalis]
MSNSTTLLDTIAVNSANKESVANALFDAASPGMLWGRHASACSGLTWGYYGGQYGSNAIANGTVTLTASTTNYVYADNVTGAVSVNTSGVPAGKISLYSIITGTTTAASYTDLRSFSPAGLASGTVTDVAAAGGIETASGSDITTTGTLRANLIPTIYTAAHTIVTGDRGQCVVMNSSSAVSEVLPTATGTSGNFPKGWFVDFANIGSGTMTLTVPTGTSLDNVTNGTLALAQNTGVTAYTDGTNWFTLRGASTGGGGGMTNPMTTLGDIITGGSGGTPMRLGIGTSGQVLTVVSGVPSWGAAGGGGSGSLVPISRQVLASNQSTITFSSISQSYSKLILKIYGRTNGSGTSSTACSIQFNSDSANHNAVLHQYTGAGGNSVFGVSNNTSSAYIGDLVQNGCPSGLAGVIELTIDEYAGTTFAKLGNYRGSFAILNGISSTKGAQGAVAYNSTSAITSFVLSLASSESFLAGTVVCLYAVQDTAATSIPPFGTFDTPPPAAAGFTGLNVSTSTLTQQSTGVLSMNDTGSGGLHVWYKAAPSTPYNIATRMRGCGISGDPSVGWVWYDSGTGKLVVVSTSITGSPPRPTLLIMYFTNSSTWSSTQLTGSLYSQDCWLKQSDDGTNLKVAISSDGQNWIQVWSASRTAFLTTPSNVGIQISANGNACAGTLFSWLQT